MKSPDGSETKAQQIVLQGVDLTSGGSLSDSQVIQLLLAQGKSFDQFGTGPSTGSGQTYY